MTLLEIYIVINKLKYIDRRYSTCSLKIIIVKLYYHTSIISGWRLDMKSEKEIKKYANQIKQILCCYLENNVYEEEISSEVWELLIYHKLDLVYYSVANKIPEQFLSQLMDRRKKVKKLYEIYEIELQKIINIFSDRGIRYVMLKGWANTLYLYLNKYDRYFSDVDILIARDNISDIEKIMEEENFIYGLSDGKMIISPKRSEIIYHHCFTHELYNMVKKMGLEFINIDYNYLFAWRCFEKEKINKVTIEEVYSHMVKKDGYIVFNENMQFVHLCCHFVNEAQFFLLDRENLEEDPRELRIFRLLDIILLLDRIDINLVNEIIDKFSCRDRIDYVMTIIQEVLGADYINRKIKWKIKKHDNNFYYLTDGRKEQWSISVFSRLFDLKKREEFLKKVLRKGE